MPDFGSWATAWWKPILFVIIAGHLTNVSVMLFLHRAQTHRGVKLHYLAALPLRIWLWLSDLKPILFVIIAGHLTNVSVMLFLHRAQTHRGVKLHYLAALPMRIWLWL